ncbi:isopeptide-forming domain-containing fimbrial protein [Lactobacillus crispatus]|uniref:Isopeptide-forming domain-containing fimbrial protein n=1 Tax=Lactobacillus crispatus TaxID=47770 RepID=A0A4Q0LUF6_9LACO|nr:isopeptide-forming domain-containing fimbrial protein [Lactobacillus crispatus]AZR16013.1 isopeptide-forming domain-containing fimbrial protein [Lactobacillus crispatus]MBI1713391.1 cell wall anchor protein [Lactobacillus crispatus]MCT7787730.1 isopeptide-forming domain-containing fimbrial protein [Lactobacillus crispatus]MCZ3784300.1 isopeptide-forming domain-containing fimbrial protein [Lactobacillus crispatus]MCZ3791975.1 isopeptide-forming domain-containing fimbrial protein [Lactobacill
MDTTRLKSNKVIGLAGAALAIVSLGFATSTTVKADNAQMQDLPKGIKAAGAKIPGQYGFRPKVMKGITKVSPFGGTSSDWATSSTNTEGKSHSWDAFRLKGNENLKGKIGVYYSNVGSDPVSGKTLDMKITLNDWKINAYKWDHSTEPIKKVALENPYAAFGVDDFEIFTPGDGALAYRVDFIDHDTGKPVKLNTQMTFLDIDGNQWVGFDSSTYSHIDNVYYGDQEGKNWLSYMDKMGKKYIYSDANLHHEALPDGSGTVKSSNLYGGFTTSLSNTDHMNITWVYGTNTGKHAVESQNELLATNGYWQLNDSNYDADAQKNKIGTIASSIWNGNFNHAYLAFGGRAILPDKPLDPKKFVSDKDEGTNVPSEIGGIKSVTHDMLENRYEQYHYQIVHSVPDVRDRFKYSEYRITDNLDNILNIDTGSIRVYNRENQDVTYMFTVTLSSGNNLSVIAKSDTLALDDFYRETYKISFDATVKPGKSLKDHADPKHKNQAVIDNQSKVITDNGSADSNIVTTNIPFTKEKDEKFVSNDGLGNTKSLVDVDFGKKYTYRVEATVPDNVDIDSLAIKDTIESDVQNIKGVKVYDYDDKDAAGNAKEITDQGKLEIDNKTGKISWTANDPANWHGKHLKMFIDTTLINTPKLLDYLNKDTSMIEIPNEAHFLFNKEDIPSNITHVSPKTPKASADKKIEVSGDYTSEDVDPTGDGDKNKNTDKDNKRETETLPGNKDE